MKILILTDHRVHGPVESIYHLAQSMLGDSRCSGISIATRMDDRNASFFADPTQSLGAVLPVNKGFVFSANGDFFKGAAASAQLTDFDVVWLRMPRSNSVPLFEGLAALPHRICIVNRPDGIIETGNKKYLVHFPELCPGIAYLDSMESLAQFRLRFPNLVLKPQNNSGGKGLIRILNDKVDMDPAQTSFAESKAEIAGLIGEGYLAMEYLDKVNEGDKRIIVANGQVVAAALRIPKEGNWLANVSLGATSNVSSPDADELAIAQGLTPTMLQAGIALFGFDTLMGNHGKRVLSEINTSCVNGIYPAQLHSGLPIVEITGKHLLDYMVAQINGNNS